MTSCNDGHFFLDTKKELTKAKAGLSSAASPLIRRKGPCSFGIVPSQLFILVSYPNTWSLIRFCGFCSNRILPYFPLVRPSVTGMISHISHINKSINAILIIRGPIKPYIFWIKIIQAIFLAKTRQDHILHPVQSNHWFWLIKKIIKNITAEAALFTLSCLHIFLVENFQPSF